MFEKLRNMFLRFVRVPLEPQPPFGDPQSLKVFRASRKLYYLRLFRWGIGQIAAFVAILFWLGVVRVSEHEAERVRAQDPALSSVAHLKAGRNKVTMGPLRKVPPIVFKGLQALEAVGVVIYLGQLIISYATTRLEYEMRWYIVTDRSLRIRSGIWTVHESTMSFANLQQVVVTQGPLQRVLGISDVRVESAGGGRGSSSEEGSSPSMHAGVFEGVENAAEIRNLILERLRHFRETGLGDPDEAVQKTEPPAIRAEVPLSSTEVVLAARDLIAESRKLRAALG
jgi:membrane protein YdbS with pleckstrin-like domain